MCNPVVALAALQAGGNVATMIQQRANARSLERHQDNIHGTNIGIAERNANVQFLQLSRRELQEREKAAQQLHSVSKQALEAAGAARVAAAEGGVAGVSFETLLGDFERQQLNFVTNTDRNLEFVEQQLGLEAEGVRARQHAQVLSTLPSPIPKPGFFDFAFAALSGGASGATQGLQIQALT